MKVRNRLLNFPNMDIIQDNDYFLFSLDSVLLANFVKIKLSDKKTMDFCCGNAPVSMLMYLRNDSSKLSFFGMELQKVIYDMGVESLEINGLSDKIKLYNDNMNNCKNYFDAECFDIVTCNPPYFKYKEGSLINENVVKSIARHEIEMNLEDVFENANYLLKNGGTFAMVHRPDRFVEIIDLMRKHNIEPKRVQFVYPKYGCEANIMLIEGNKNGKCGLKVMEPLIVYDDDGNYCSLIKKMFGGEDDVAKEL